MKSPSAPGNVPQAGMNAKYAGVVEPAHEREHVLAQLPEQLLERARGPRARSRRQPPLHLLRAWPGAGRASPGR